MPEPIDVNQDHIDKANQEIGALCAGKTFTMSIPVQPTDSDIVLSDGLRGVQALLAERDHLLARADHATVELLTLGRELRQMQTERDQARAEVWEWRNRLAERSDELSKERVDRDRAVAEAAVLRSIVDHSAQDCAVCNTISAATITPLAAHAAAVLATSVRIRELTEATGKGGDIPVLRAWVTAAHEWEAATDAYRAVLAGQGVA